MMSTVAVALIGPLGAATILAFSRRSVSDEEVRRWEYRFSVPPSADVRPQVARHLERGRRFRAAGVAGGLLIVSLPTALTPVSPTLASMFAGPIGIALAFSALTLASLLLAIVPPTGEPPTGEHWDEEPTSMPIPTTSEAIRLPMRLIVAAVPAALVGAAASGAATGAWGGLAGGIITLLVAVGVMTGLRAAAARPAAEHSNHWLGKARHADVCLHLFGVGLVTATAGALASWDPFLRSRGGLASVLATLVLVLAIGYWRALVRDARWRLALTA